MWQLLCCGRHSDIQRRYAANEGPHRASTANVRHMSLPLPVREIEDQQRGCLLVGRVIIFKIRWTASAAAGIKYKEGEHYQRQENRITA